jgi:hypothetical protein
MKTSKLKSSLSFIGFLGIIGIVIAFTTNSTKLYKPVKETQGRWKNLKVLPQNISEDSLHFVMKTFNTSLGVHCDYCHAAKADDPKKLDFASDTNYPKNVARQMLEMTNGINEKYFQENGGKPNAKQETAVYCYTCHRGNTDPGKPYPDASNMMSKAMPQMKQEHK